MHIHGTNKKSVALSSVFAGAVLTLMKLVVGLMTNSIGILSEAAHSSLDFAAALITYFAVRVSDKPADDEHPYGHGKVESFSALVETALLYITSFWIIWEAVERLFLKKVNVEVTWYSITVVITSIIIDYTRSRALYKAAKEHSSQALEADALHFSSDIWSSLVVLFGLVFVYFGMGKADAIAAIIVSILVLYVGYKLGKRTVDVLLDAAPKGLIERVNEATKKVEGVLDIGKIRVRPVGPSVFIDMNISVGRKISIDKSHDICDKIENEIRQLIPQADITIHTCPLPQDNETIIERVKIVAFNHDLAVHDVAVQTLNDKKYLNFDLEVKADLDIQEAHQVATQLEEAIKDEFGDDINISIHIEPLEFGVMNGEPVLDQEAIEISKVILNIAKELKPVREVHDIQIRKTKGKLFISLHSLFDNNTPLEDAHLCASRFEYLIKQELPDTKRVVVHTEPISEKH